MTTHIKDKTLLQATNISLQYDDNIILRDINFCIKDIIRPGMQQGQVISLIGRSGIGKTQLFKILSGLQQPSGGTVTIHDNQIVKAGDMGVIFQNYYLFEWRSVYQSLLLAAKKNLALKGQEAAMIEHYAKEFNLEDELEKISAAIIRRPAPAGKHYSATIAQRFRLSYY